MSVKLEQSIKILQRGKFIGRDQIRFFQVDDDTQTDITSIDILQSDWSDMGYPDQITVTINPGDLLNT